MYKFKFWVNCKGWAAGGYENTHFARTEQEAHDIVDQWNKQYGHHVVDLLSVEPITDEYFAENYMDDDV